MRELVDADSPGRMIRQSFCCHSIALPNVDADGHGATVYLARLSIYLKLTISHFTVKHGEKTTVSRDLKIDDALSNHVLPLSSYRHDQVSRRKIAMGLM